MMRKLLFVSALLVASLAQPMTPAAAKGPKPVPTGDCRLDISGRTQCAYFTQSECLSALRALKREYGNDVYGCNLSTADPNWWHYGKYVLEYYA